LEIDRHHVQASIPLGVRTGTRVRLAGRGEPGQNGGAAGDLFLIINVLPNEIFERAGDDLHFDASVDIFTAIAGGEIRIPALEKPLTLTIPPRTNANQTFRLRGKGMPYLREPNKRGDMFARIKLVLPNDLTDQEIGSITALASTRQKHVEPSEVKI
jgi:curved DNA-binding protein